MPNAATLAWFLAVATCSVFLPWFGTFTTAEMDTELAAGRIARGESYRPEALDASLSAVGGNRARGLCNAAQTRATVLIAANRIEQALDSGKIDRIDPSSSRMEQAVRDNLSCSPGDALGWLGAAWGRLMQGQATPTALHSLQISFDLAPYEVWIAARRSYIASSLSSRLTDEARRNLGHDFILLLRAGLVKQAASLISTTGYAVRGELFEKARNVPEILPAFIRLLDEDITLDAPAWASDMMKRKRR